MNKRVKRQHGTSLHASGEDYLEAVLVLQKEKGMVRSVDVARHMGVSKPSVCHAVATLKEGGFLTMDGDFFLRLTDVGREVAEQTYEKHCFFTRLLTEAGVDPKTAEQEACRMEHCLSEGSFEKLAALLSEQFGVDVDSITMDTSFEDLGADSLDIVEMTMAVEEEFGLEDMDEEDLSGISTVADLVRYLKSKLED